MEIRNKKMIYFLFLFFIMINLYSIEYSNKIYSGFDKKIFFYQDYFRLEVLNRDTGKLEKNQYKYKIKKEKVYNYLFFGEKYENKWLMLYSDQLLFLYDENDKQKFMGIIGNNIASESFILGKKFDSTSFLTEDQYTYDADNLKSSFYLNKPWANGGNKYGLKEKIFITKQKGTKEIIFSNGFVSYKKPYLYKMNSRVKKVKITDQDRSNELIIDLVDTPNLQVFKLDFETELISIEILEVYEGTKFKDTCLNFIIFRL